MVELITEKFRTQTLQDFQSQNQILTESAHQVPRLASDWCLKPGNDSAFKAATKKPCEFRAAESSNAFSAFKQTKIPQRSLETPTFGGIYRKKVPCHVCQFCDATPHTPPAPKKRRCRSLSIPNGSTWSSCRCHLSNPPNLWKPVALRPHLNNNKLLKSRNSPLACLRNSSGSIGTYRGGGTSPGVWMRSSSEFSSPPDSPVPRPASVSSGYYDSSMSSLGAPWLDQASPQHFHFNVFQNRSLSLEEPISDHSHSVSATAGSMPTMVENINSTPSSPRRHKILRCRSQPCVLHERRGGLKRRREEEMNRPNIDFNKMTETAYDYERFRRPKPVSTSRPQDIRSPSRTLASIFSQQEQVFGLKPITGSPLDNSIPNTVVVSPATSPTKEVSEEMDSKLSDSGCSDTGDPPEILSFPSEPTDLESCNCHDMCTEEVFQIDVGNELDLDLIEND